MQVNAFGFPLGTSTAGGTPAGAPALGFLQALGVAGAGQPVAPTGGTAILPVTSLAEGGQTLTLTSGTAPSMHIGGPATLAGAALPLSNAAVPLLPQNNDTLATLAATPAPTVVPASGQPILAANDAPAAPAVSVPDKPVLTGLQTSTSLSGLLATVARLPAETALPAAPAALYNAKTPVGQPVTAQLVATQPATTKTTNAPLAPAPALATPVAAAAKATTAGNPAPLAPEAQTIATASPPTEATAPVEGEMTEPSTMDGDQPAMADMAQPLPPAPPLHAPLQQVAAQPVPLPAATQPPAQLQPESQSQPGTRQLRSAPVQANAGEAPGRAARKVASDDSLAPGAVTKTLADPVGGDFARAVQATANDAALTQDNGQSRDPQLALAPVSQPAGAAAATGASPSTPAAPVAQEPVVVTRAGQFGHAMGVEIARKVEAGEETLRVRLNPDNLGRIEVTLAFDDGNLKATVRAESQRALDLLRQDMPDLARTLDQAGIRTDAQSFRFEARADTGSGQQQGGGQQQRGNNPQQQHAHADDLEPAPAYRAIRGDGQVDLLA